MSEFNDAFFDPGLPPIPTQQTHNSAGLDSESYSTKKVSSYGNPTSEEIAEPPAVDISRSDSQDKEPPRQDIVSDPFQPYDFEAPEEPPVHDEPELAEIPPRTDVLEDSTDKEESAVAVHGLMGGGKTAAEMAVTGEMLEAQAASEPILYYSLTPPRFEHEEPDIAVAQEVPETSWDTSRVEQAGDRAREQIEEAGRIAAQRHTVDADDPLWENRYFGDAAATHDFSQTEDQTIGTGFGPFGDVHPFFPSDTSPKEVDETGNSDPSEADPLAPSRRQDED